MYYFYAGISYLLFIATFLLGSRINGAKNWIRLGKNFAFQPSELIKIAFVFLIAAYYKNREKFEKDLQDKINMSKDLLNNFDFEIIKKMTIMNSHGDYSVQQLIYNDNSKITVIDFETAKKLPIIWEVLRSYSYIDEEAKNGELNIDTLVEYVKEFAKYVQLNEYDLKYAAQLYLIQIVSSPFGYKQYNDDYEKKGLLEFALFRTNLCRYLYNNSKEISTRLQK